MRFSELNADSTKLLLQFLREEFTNRTLSEGLWQNLEEQYGERLYPELLYYLTQTQFGPDDAKRHWRSIIAHRDELTKELGRDVGLRVSLADYFINVHPTVNNPIIMEINLFLKQEERAFRDELTGLFNRRFFNRMFQQELERGRRYQEPVSLLIVDVDHFKEFNDNYGHPSGDQALVELAAALEKTCRSIDHLTRYGGEEFALILPRADQTEALCAAERLRFAVEEHEFLGRSDLHLTVSIGTATYPIDAEEGLELLEKADKALYEAKRGGRNCISGASADKREHPRYTIDLNMVFHDLQNPARQGELRTKNISVGGMLGKTTDNIGQGDSILFRLHADASDAVRTLTGRCVHVSQDENDQELFFIGIRFELKNEEERKYLQELIKQQAAAVTH